MRPLERLARLGLLGPNFIGVHAVHVNEAEIGAAGRNTAATWRTARRPISNSPPASRRWRELLHAGVNVGLGTDGAASNNRLDLFGEMRLAALLAKGVSGDAAALPAARRAEGSHAGRARALGLDDQIGCIVPGKRADLVAVDCMRPRPASRCLTPSRTWFTLPDASRSATCGSTAS